MPRFLVLLLPSLLCQSCIYSMSFNPPIAGDQEATRALVARAQAPTS